MKFGLDLFDLKTPTEEQQKAIDNFKIGGNLKINAYAGSGKTTTLEFLANATNKKGQYIAFNNAIVKEASDKFPSNVSCNTSHSLAFRAVAQKHKFAVEKLFNELTTKQVMEILNLKKIVRLERYVLEPLTQAHLILETIEKFCQSDTGQIQKNHVPSVRAFATLTKQTEEDFKEYILNFSNTLWLLMRDNKTSVFLGHDGYLKLWALTEPKINSDYILLDEAQDTNPVVLDILEKQNAQIIYVGDKYQQIYDWRGAVNAMDSFSAERDSYLTQSFRFGEAIAILASQLLSSLDAPKSLTGNTNKLSTIGPTPAPYTIISRTNAVAIAELMAEQESGAKVHLIGGVENTRRMLRGVQELKDRRPTSVSDFFGFSNWNDVRDFSKIPEGEYLKRFVDLVEHYGEDVLDKALKSTVQADAAKTVITTAHKAKGREWKNVRLTSDYLLSEPISGGVNEAEIRLLYVAVTRAMDCLDIPFVIDVKRNGY